MEKIRNAIESLVWFAVLMCIVYFALQYYFSMEDQTDSENSALVESAPEVVKEKHKTNIRTTLYKWVDENGVTQFSDGPPDVRQTRLEFKEVVTPNVSADIKKLYGNEKPTEYDAEISKAETGESLSTSAGPNTSGDSKNSNPIDAEEEDLEPEERSKGYGFNAISGACKDAKKKLRDLRMGDEGINSSAVKDARKLKAKLCK